MADRRLLERGERAPDFVAANRNGTLTRFYGTAGGTPTVLLFAGTPIDGARLRDVAAGLVAAGSSLQVVTRDTPASNAATASAHELDCALLSDPDGKVTAMYGVDDVPMAFVLDANLRIVATHAGPPLLPAIVASLPPPPPDVGEVVTHAPVLLVPDVLDASTCEELVATFHAGGNVETGVEQSAADARADALNPQSKRRRDHIVRDPELLRALSTAIGRRVMPELRKAFAYRATRFEGFKIARYDDSAGGFFAAHRDNLSPTTAHRRFALTLNLNKGYDGGHLRFPEYGTALYRPAAGEALLFSCAHLHEVLPVTRGERFVLLSFLFADEPHRGA